MNTATNWDALLNGSKLSQAISLDKCEEIASYRSDIGTVFTLWRERHHGSKGWLVRVSCGDYTESYKSIAAAKRAHPAFS